MGCNTSTAAVENEKRKKEEKKDQDEKKVEEVIESSETMIRARRVRKVSENEDNSKCETVEVPPAMTPLFLKAEQIIDEFFSKIAWRPRKSEIRINDDRFVLIRGPSLTVELYKLIMINSNNENSGEKYYRNLIFDLAHNMGKCDCDKTFEKKKEINPMSRLSCGPVYFSFTGFARVRLLPGCNPSVEPDEFCFMFEHPFSFEACSFREEGFKTKYPICIMSSGYSSGWCSESFGLNLITFELTCTARGDESCLFVMAEKNHIFDKIENLKKEGLIPLRAQKNMYVPKEFPGIIKEELSLGNMNISKKKVEKVKKENKQLMEKIIMLEIQIEEKKKKSRSDT